MLRTALLASMGALALAACGDSKTDPAKEQAAIAKVAPPEGKSWSEVVAATPDGGYVMGNPEASIRVIEFASITCPACAQFSNDSHEELKREFVDSGRVSFELRNFVRDALDATSAAIIRCAPAERYFPLMENVFASQNELFQGAQADPQAVEAALALPPEQRFRPLAAALKLDQFFQARGLTGDQINACLSDLGNIQKLEQGVNKATEQYRVAGTPTFVINGQVADGVSSWPLLRDRLRLMGAR
ncbi:MAG TPA: thioredoxin domain-containing protein [Sphingopyxis sp.]|nr:thioredoxin domain-containing protein [Sphingopyxis sp.]